MQAAALGDVMPDLVAHAALPELLEVAADAGEGFVGGESRKEHGDLFAMWII